MGHGLLIRRQELSMIVKELCTTSTLEKRPRWFAVCVAHLVSARKTARNGLNKDIGVDKNRIESSSKP
jgi:hypothetical protein